MFNNNTVFLLGAGASWHYGYPTGEQLVKKVATTAREVGEFFKKSSRLSDQPDFVKVKRPLGGSPDQIYGRWLAAAEDCFQLCDRLTKVNPLVIDYFLGLNPPLQEVGKLMIAVVLLQCEAAFRKSEANINRRELLAQSPLRRDRNEAGGVDITLYKDDWYRFILHRLVTDCPESSDLAKKTVKFVSFNYDVSIETSLYNGLMAIHFFNQSDIEHFFSSDRFLHVYGRIRDYRDKLDIARYGRSFLHAQPNDGDWHRCRYVLDEAYTASKNLNVIDPHAKSANSLEIKAAVEAINDARVLYILGSGFDKNNNTRLGMNDSLFLNQQAKCVMFTNFRNSERINKAASRLFFRHPSEFSPGRPLVIEGPRFYCEKSMRDVYEALELDFDSLEDQSGIWSIGPV